MLKYSSDDERTIPRRPGGSGRLRIEEVGGCLFASVGGADPFARAQARQLQPEEDRVALVIPQIGSAILPELTHGLREWVPVKWDSVRLVSSGAARTDHAGPAPAQQLADQLGVEVLAPDGDVVSVPGGSLFVLTPPERPASGRGAWWRFRPGRDPQQLGRRGPEPQWERQLAGVVESRLSLGPLILEEVPCGLWVRRAGTLDHRELVFGIPTDPSSVALVVSRPGDPPLLAADIRHLIESMPAALYEHLVLIPYGDHPLADARLGAAGSAAANQTLRVRTGLPLEIVDGGRHVVAVGDDGSATWRPFALEIAWRPYGGARVHTWISPAPQLLPIGAAQLALNDRWLVEVVETGLWIHEMDRVAGAATVRDLPLDSQYCTVVVGVLDEEQDQPPWRAIARMLSRLPADARCRLRVAVAEEAGVRMIRAAAKLQARIAGGPSWLLDDSGQLVPQTHRSDRSMDRDDVEPEPFVDEETSDVKSLLTFIDEIRRTRSWDEHESDMDSDMDDVAKSDPLPALPPPPEDVDWDAWPIPENNDRILSIVGRHAVDGSTLEQPVVPAPDQVVRGGDIVETKLGAPEAMAHLPYTSAPLGRHSAGARSRWRDEVPL